MKLIDNKLYMSFQDMVECGVSEGYLKKAKSAGTKCWHFINDPEDKRKVLIGYDELKQDYKDVIKQRFGDPYNMIARQPILDMVVQDPKAYDYFFQYTYLKNGVPNRLVIKRVNEYTRAASWLGMLAKVQADKAIIKQQLKLSKIPDFYCHVTELLKIEIANTTSETYTGQHILPASFPTSYQRMIERAARFTQEGYDSIIDPTYGNKRAAKIGKTVEGFDPELEKKQMSIIRGISSKHNNLDAEQVAKLANVLFEKNGWETLSGKRVGQIMTANKPKLVPGRQGKRAFNSNYSMQIMRTPPKYPTAYFTLDGWTVELLYQSAEGYNNRLVLVVVLDACGKYPVGYAIGERENAELIREANRNALLHLQDLFKGAYRPYQIQSDRYALKTLTPFYQAVGHLHTPAAVGNAKSKIIERYFLELNKNYCQLQPNWSGFGITSRKENQVNSEMLDLTKKSFPDKAGVLKQIHAIMATERKKKIADYLAAWENTPEENKQLMSDMDWLYVFGVPLKGTNRITGQGIVKVIEGQQITYDTFEPAFRAHAHLDWQVIADLDNLNKVLAISPDGKLRFVLEKKLAVSMDIMSATPEENEYRSQVHAFNKNLRQEITDMYAQDAEVIRDVVNNTPLALDDVSEAALKHMFTYSGQQKEALQDAKNLKQIETKERKTQKKEAEQKAVDWAAMQKQFMQSQVDFNEYID